MTAVTVLLSLRTNEIRVGDIVHEHGMRVRIDRIRVYHHGQCSSVRGALPGFPYKDGACLLGFACLGTVLNVREATGDYGIPRSFLHDPERAARGPGHGREDYWNVQGNTLARWQVGRPDPAAGQES